MLVKLTDIQLETPTIKLKIVIWTQLETEPHVLMQCWANPQLNSKNVDILQKEKTVTHGQNHATINSVDYPRESEMQKRINCITFATSKDVPKHMKVAYTRIVCYIRA